jgi:hypothetical protein
MKTARRLFFTAILALALANSSLGKENRFPVSVAATANDIVGGRLAYKVKEEVRRSASMHLVDPDEAGVHLVLVTLPRDTNNPSFSTVYSAVWTLKHDELFPSYLNSQVGYCGSDAVDSQAESLVAETDKIISDLKSLFKTALQLIKETKPK